MPAPMDACIVTSARTLLNNCHAYNTTQHNVRRLITNVNDFFNRPISLRFAPPAAGRAGWWGKGGGLARITCSTVTMPPDD